LEWCQWVASEGREWRHVGVPEGGGEQLASRREQPGILQPAERSRFATSIGRFRSD
jgi:hypothetical protein